MKTAFVIGLYIAGLIFSNLLLTYYGATYVHLVGFVIIPLDMLARDILHRTWESKKLWLKMGALISSGGLITVLLNIDSYEIVLASLTAYIIATLTNTLIYSSLKRQQLATRMILSSLPAAILDSIVFIYMIFAMQIELIIIQAAVKCFGVILWTELYTLIKSKWNYF